MERYIVACYDAESGGHFNAHRDDTTFGTAHRRFACTINLNAENYDGGDLSFPEFGTRRYRAPTGGAVVFSCSLLHKVDTVTRGQALRVPALPLRRGRGPDCAPRTTPGSARMSASIVACPTRRWQPLRPEPARHRFGGNLLAAVGRRGSVIQVTPRSSIDRCSRTTRASASDASPCRASTRASTAPLQAP